MRIAAIGHSLVHMRQWLFFRELASQGHDVLMVAPQQWHHLSIGSHISGTLIVRALPVSIMGDIYHFNLLGARGQVQAFKPDWIYLMQEAQSDLAQEAWKWSLELECRCALFVWENIQKPGSRERDILNHYDLVVCGNQEAHDLVAGWARKIVVLPQVGIDPDIFKPCPGKKEVEVAFLGRPVPEKGIEYLMLAWPDTKILPWENYQDLPTRYSQASLVVVYSHDTPGWKEQAMPYVAIESLACGTPVIVSDTASSVFWLTGCPGVEFVPQRSPAKLREVIEKVLRFGMSSGRDWVVERFSNQVVARRLVECLAK